jgi:acetoin utilization deacetylase AcuC-like enzyme
VQGDAHQHSDTLLELATALAKKPSCTLHSRRLYELAALTAGGSLQAAAGLCSGKHRLAVHLDGGRHHAHKSLAAGFCYVNDVVRLLLLCCAVLCCAVLCCDAVL